jgi:hypothetical protein
MVVLKKGLSGLPVTPNVLIFILLVLIVIYLTTETMIDESICKKELPGKQPHSSKIIHFEKGNDKKVADGYVLCCYNEPTEDHFIKQICKLAKR